MKKVSIVFIILVVCILISHLLSQEISYVGAAKCKICHKSEKQGKQFLIWESSMHSQSFKPLTLDETKATVGDAPENPKCLKCHAPLYEKAPNLKEEGVTCEVCHGPGNIYKKLSIMKDRDASAKNGLILYGSNVAIKTHCMKCHENAHYKAFDFDTRWEKIKHPKPEK
jgi:hypothetical protein